MSFDLVAFLGFVGVALVVIAVRRRSRGGSDAEEQDRSVAQRKDVLRALKSMRKD